MEHGLNQVDNTSSGMNGAYNFPAPERFSEHSETLQAQLESLLQILHPSISCYPAWEMVLHFNHNGNRLRNLVKEL